MHPRMNSFLNPSQDLMLRRDTSCFNCGGFPLNGEEKRCTSCRNLTRKHEFSVFDAIEPTQQPFNQHDINQNHH
jgi:DNA polymerase II large subunit